MDSEQIDGLIRKYENPRTYYTLPTKIKGSAAEMYLMRWLFDNRIELLKADLDKSDTEKAVIEDGKIRLPLKLMPSKNK